MNVIVLQLKHEQPGATESVSQSKAQKPHVFFSNEACKEKASPENEGGHVPLLTKSLTEILWSFRRVNLYHSQMSLSLSFSEVNSEYI